MPLIEKANELVLGGKPFPDSRSVAVCLFHEVFSDPFLWQ